MERIAYKTRGMSDPQGKQKVWFCCHPDDFETYFTPISDEILQLYDCAIWYDSDPNAPIDAAALQEDLSQMTLFVIPVTTKFLTQENRALNVEFSYAQERHIPVLPLVQESGLEELFGAKCGNIQFLDPNQSDPTAISYEEKFKRFLGAILLGDELAKRVRAAFDAYIFLSYRKKDRKYAQELMRLIHQNPMYRDVAIWYDEFLTIGEDFNENIRAALEKSGLFALVVTPNLINELNYVLTTEYPMARAAGKPILPVEMEETEGQALADAYEGIPAPTDGQNEEALQQALGQAILHLALNEQRGEPEHLFCIGLAYLSGIDVEVDHDRAVRLITTAAEAGLPEAVEKLVSMYNTGEGVERNYETAAQWQERLADLLESIYKETGSEESAEQYLSALWDLGNLWYEMGQLTPAKKAYERMLEAAERLAQEANTADARRRMAMGYVKLGDIANAEKDPANVKAWYQKAFAFFEILAYETKGERERLNLSIIYDRLGAAAKAEGDLTGAKAWYLKALGICEALVSETNSENARRVLSLSYICLGGIAAAERNWADAKEWYRKALSVREALERETNSVQARRDLSVCYVCLGNVGKAEKDWTEAKTWYTKALTIREALADETNTVQARRDLSAIYEKLGIIAGLEGDIDGAKDWHMKALDIRAPLSRETDTVQSQQDLVSSCEKLGVIANYEGDRANKIGWFLLELIYYFRSLARTARIQKIWTTIQPFLKKWIR